MHDLYLSTVIFNALATPGLILTWAVLALRDPRMRRAPRPLRVSGESHMTRASRIHYARMAHLDKVASHPA
jgi:hypothetical protein